jgi:hypothetical protein
MLLILALKQEFYTKNVKLSPGCEGIDYEINQGELKC